jgi:fused signal recognition particle receptor
MAIFSKIGEKFAGILKKFRKIDDEFLDELEEILITGDFGSALSAEIIKNLREKAKSENINDAAALRELLRRELKTELTDSTDENSETFPKIIMVVGVNGVGKTTSIAKLAAFYKNFDKKVVLAAADTFRAAASEQLSDWAKKIDVPVISRTDGADPAAIVYDALENFNENSIDVLIIDTAGRLHNKQNLMLELAKIDRIISRKVPEITRETLLVLDATTGQNALSQAKSFAETMKITGIILTKLDGTSKGGVVFAVTRALKIPIRFIGVGEKSADLAVFCAENFVNEIL